ncbi:MAG TPA: tripartite tricarboxylate transporter TctB family protein [Bacillus sp. (in: firmicutes)]|uniref:tripartite tricarboxylate transporter TctB family protein n=1 Tax=Bacillus litorisediminis TaxID=2922713 RepID=UPI001FAE4BCF|nr:tripartite tricarboxylate transporter TctB family protein [Bacillus litorisediminis]HWO74506.1 tripartite tricarboxylate transporter TctB family protein [Bacillus sp. (in: firmicutes)]
MTLANRVIGTILLLLSVYVWVTANAFPEATGVGPGADFFPKLTAAVLGVLSILLVLKKENTEDPIFLVAGNQALKFVLGFLAMIVFVFLIEGIGFTITAVLFTAGWMWLMGIRKIVKLTIVSVFIGLLITLVFEQLLNVPIPHGILY